MLTIFLIFIFIISLFIGSFLNVIIDRVIRDEQFIKGRSHCESCGHELHLKDLIPLLSFIWLKGKCRYCHASIPKILPITELTVAITYASIFYWYLYKSSFSITSTLLSIDSLFFLLFILILFTLLILIFFSDLRYKLIPDIYTLLLVVNFIIFAIIRVLFNLDFAEYSVFFTPIISHVISAVSMLIFFAALFFITRKKALGEGDIYLSGALAIYLTFQLSIIMWFGAFILGSVVGVFLMVVYKKGRKYMIPFGPFLVLGFIVTLLWGNQIINWYLSLLHY